MIPVCGRSLTKWHIHQSFAVKSPWKLAKYNHILFVRRRHVHNKFYNIVIG